MAAKNVEVPGVGMVALHKRHGVRGVKLSIAHDGTVRVTLPNWAPYRLGIEFAKNKAEWIASTRRPKLILTSGDRVGKAHRFLFQSHSGISTTSTRIVGTDIKIIHPANVSIQSTLVQEAAEKAAIRALKKEAEQLLPQRLKTLADQHGFTYSSVGVKRLKSRWGSCNERKEIILNCFLMQLPWHLIDYVLLHELVHTKVLRHGNPFWSELSKYTTNLTALRKEMKSYQPALQTVPALVRESSEQHIDVLD